MGKAGRAPSGWGMIRGRGNLCIQTAKNKRIRQGPCNRHNNSLWRFIKGGKFELKGLNSGKCLDNTGKARNKQGYHQWSCSGGNANQHFKFLRSGGARRKGEKGRSAR